MVNAARTASRYWPSTYDSALRHGYELQFDYTISRLLSNTTPAYEILNNNGGGLDLALMHPLSRGTVKLASADAFTAPLIDPRWLANPFDLQVLISAMRFNQRIINTQAIQRLQPSYDTVPQDASAEALTAYLMKNLRTEFHYAGTCAMMPQQQGGVVDPNLLVYGTENVRVVDTSVFPIIPGAHLQAVAYAVAEKVSVAFSSSSSENADFNTGCRYNQGCWRVDCTASGTCSNDRRLHELAGTLSTSLIRSRTLDKPALVDDGQAAVMADGCAYPNDCVALESLELV